MVGGCYIAADSLTKQRAILVILLATCDRALEAFEAADNNLDKDFVTDLRRVMERTRKEIDVLSAQIPKDAA